MITSATVTQLKTVLHLGCGSGEIPSSLFSREEWKEIKVDLDKRYKPDVVADIRDLPFEDESHDAIYLFAVLEHIEEAFLGKVLGGFNRVLRDDGQLVVTVPDLEGVAKALLKSGPNVVLEDTDAGPVRALDMLYGYAPSLPAYPLMTHRTGFTPHTLAYWLQLAGFEGELFNPTRYLLTADVRKVGPHQFEEGASVLYEKKKEEE